MTQRVSRLMRKQRLASCTCLLILMCMLFMTAIMLYPMYGFVSHQEDLSSRYHFSRVEVETYGMFGLSKRQQIKVLMDHRASLAEAFDLSIFGPLRPGVTHDEASSIVGQPVDRIVDRDGQTWLAFAPEAQKMFVGCRCILSDNFLGEDEYLAKCTWQLEAHITFDAALALVSSGLSQFIDSGKRIAENVDSRRVSIYKENGERLDIFVSGTSESFPTILWQAPRESRVYGVCSINSAYRGERGD